MRARRIEHQNEGLVPAMHRRVRYLCATIAATRRLDMPLPNFYARSLQRTYLGKPK